MLKHRVLTALILIPLVILCILYLPLFAFMFAWAAILGLGIWEWSHLMGVKNLGRRLSYLILVLLLFAVAWFFPRLLVLSLGVVGWLLALFYIFKSEKFAQLWSHGSFIQMLIGIWIFVPSWIALVHIRSYPQGAFYLLLLLALIWSTDTGAYFFGRWLGKRKLAPKISPGKTQVGFWGGLISALLVAAAVGLILKLQWSDWWWLLLFSLLISLTSVVGDLFESLVKRQGGIKDSGQWLPGHGGILDRLDSLLAAGTICAFALEFLIFK